MLESVLAGVLNKFLSAYVSLHRVQQVARLPHRAHHSPPPPRTRQVDNLDPKQLNFGIWSGDTKLRNLRLKKEALDKFRLPVDVVEGYLGDLKLSIPWCAAPSRLPIVMCSSPSRFLA